MLLIIFGITHQNFILTKDLQRLQGLVIFIP